MKNISLAFIAACVIGLSPAWADGITNRSAVMSLDNLKKTVEIPNFKIGGTYDYDKPEAWENGGEGGVTLESLGAEPLKASYIAVGTPERNEAGEIVNAIVINSYYSGDATNTYNFWYEGQAGNGFSKGALVGPGRTFDTNKYYVVMVDALGLWGNSKPSDGLGIKFPQYSYQDMVQVNYRLLRDHLNIAEVDLVTGVSMGGTQTYVWGVMHSGFVKAIMPIGGTTQSDGEDPFGNWVFQLASAAIKSDPVWKETGGDYYDRPKAGHPNKGVEFSWSVLSETGLAISFRADQPWDTVQKDVFYWDYPNENAGANLRGRADQYDAVDLIYRNRTGETHNINDDLHRVTADTLVIHVKNDQWLNFKLAERASKRVPGAKLLGVPETPLSHYAVFSALNTEAKNMLLVDFLADVDAQAESPQYVAEGYRVPSVDAEIDPAKSLWKDHMTYPFDSQYAQVSDNRGTTYEVSYMDVSPKGVDNPDTLVLVHGKGAFGALYGDVIRTVVERGFRVIVPDLPHYGRSGPGNLDKPRARSMKDLSDVVHNLVVKELGVEKAHYFGHSLGGHLVLRNAIDYPDAVKSLVLEAPAGLETYPAEIDLGTGPVALFDKEMSHDWDAWEKVWGPLGLLDGELNKTEQQVRDFFYFKKRDAAGNEIPSEAGYFFREGPYAKLHTDQRVGLIKGNQEELKQWVDVFIFDIHTMAAEMVEGDPNSIPNRIGEIKAPIFLAFGSKEPFIPAPAFNGLTDLANDVITPTMMKMAAAGNQPQLKIYPGAGHFIHSDEPVEFAHDVADFLEKGVVNSFTPAMVDAVFNGAPEAASAGAAKPAASTKGLNK